MVMHGHVTTLPATVALIAGHTQAVVRGAGQKWVIADMPFLSYRKGLAKTMHAVEQLMHAGAHAIKLEGVEGNETLIQHIVQSGVPVMGHIGLTPQSIHQLGGFHVQGKQNSSAEKLLQQAHRLQDNGCFAIVLECVPADLAKRITQQLTIPTIGIGAGPHVDGQVLVLQDLLGFDPKFKPKFLKTYMAGFELIQSALNTFNEEVKNQQFPQAEQSY
jgi:3-methyl-2-oxobutanoate hydroxymethyltransferase